jgi:Fe2+ or Zn2+ uptake regulation protein
LGDTQQRQTILDVLRESREHLTAEEIYLLANKRRSSISLSTVYRNLGILVKQSRILSITAPERPTYFDYNTMPHHHLICEVCGKLLDIPSPDFDLQNLVPAGYKVLSSSLVVNCICDGCQKTLAGKSSQ